MNEIKYILLTPKQKLIKLEKEKIPFDKALEKALDGRTGKWLCDRTGLSPAVVSLLSSGRLKPSDTQIEKIKKVFPDLDYNK